MTARRLIRPGDGDPRHGTANAYRNLRCRCLLCVEAGNQQHKVVIDRMVARGLEENDSRHGSLSTYVNWKCRCGMCTEARRAYERALRARKAESARVLAGGPEPEPEG